MKRKQTVVRFDANKTLDLLTHLLVNRPKGWFNLAVRLNNNLVKFLRDSENPVPDWDSFPVARSWFTQNVMFLGEGTVEEVSW